MPAGVRNSLADPSAKSRIQLELHPKNRAQLQALLEATDAASYSEVIRRALALYDAAIRAKVEGRQFGVFEPAEGVFTQVVIL